MKRKMQNKKVYPERSQKSHCPERSRRGFTLIELLIVIAIIAILAVVVIINLEKARVKSRDSERKTDLTGIASSLEMYKADHKQYINSGNAFVPVGSDDSCSEVPSDLLCVLIDDAEGNSYISTLPQDPKDGVYQYRSDEQQYKITAESEVISSSDDEEYAKNNAGDFYNPIANQYHYFQVSSSATALQWTIPE